MLILSREANERIFIDIPEGCRPGTRITLTVLETHRHKTRLGLTAPQGVEIKREEIADGWTNRRLTGDAPDV